MTSYAAELGDLNGDGFIDILVGVQLAPLVHIGQLDGVTHTKLAGVRFFLPGDHAKERGFAGAIGTDDTHDATGGQLEAEVFVQHLVPIGLGDAIGINDHLTQAGTPGSRHYGWYELYEIDELATVGKMLDLIRHSQLGKVRLDKYMRYDALIGTPQISAEKAFGLR